MNRKLLDAALVALLLPAALTAFAPAWPDQPPDKVLISGPGIEGQVEIKDPASLAIFRLGHLEDLNHSAPAATMGSGYKIARFFYDGTFDFARLTYYPDPSGGQGRLYWEDGPDLRGNRTPYDRRWLYVTASGEGELRALLKRLGAPLDATAPEASAANAAAGQPSQAPGAQPASDSIPSALASALIALAVAAAGLMGVLWFWRARSTNVAR